MFSVCLFVCLSVSFSQLSLFVFLEELRGAPVGGGDAVGKAAGTVGGDGGPVKLKMG